MSAEFWWVVTGAAYVFSVVTLFRVGRSNSTATGFWPLVTFSTSMAFLVVMPIALLAMFRPETELLPGPIENLLYGPFDWMIPLWSVSSLVTLVNSLRPPVVIPGTKLQLLPAGDLLDHIWRIADRLRLPRPVVYMWPTLAGSPVSLAMIRGTLTPHLMISNQTSPLLTPEEFEALIESILRIHTKPRAILRAILLPVLAIIAVAIQLYAPRIPSIFLATVVYYALDRVILQRLFFLSDEETARSVGPTHLISMIKQVYRHTACPKSVFWNSLFWSISGTPSEEQRLTRIYRTFPELGSIESETVSTSQFFSRLNAIALIAWSVLIAVACVYSIQSEAGSPILIPWIVLYFCGVAGSLLGFFSHLQFARLNQKRARAGSSLGKWVGLALTPYILISLLVFEVWPDVVGPAVGIGLLIWLLTFIIFCIKSLRRSMLRRRVFQALLRNDYVQCIRLSQRYRRRIQKDPLAWYNATVAKALAGQRESAMQDLEAIWTRFPTMSLAGMMLVRLLLEEGESDLVAECLQQLEVAATYDPSVHFLRARFCRLQGDFEQADEAVLRCRKLVPKDADVIGMQALIALDRNDPDTGTSLLSEAEAVNPAAPFTFLARAKLALMQDHPNQLQFVQEAVSGCESQPIYFIAPELQPLKDWLAARQKDLSGEVAQSPDTEADACRGGS